MIHAEYSISEMRSILQQLFPSRRLVLSQFTLFHHIGVAKPTGTTFRRKRRCFRLLDLLPIACVLALKEQGIPLKNIGNVPSLLQEHAQRIFEIGRGCRISGSPEGIHLSIPGDATGENGPLSVLLAGDLGKALFWGFDVGTLADQLYACAQSLAQSPMRQADVEPLQKVA